MRILSLILCNILTCVWLVAPARAEVFDPLIMSAAVNSNATNTNFYTKVDPTSELCYTSVPHTGRIDFDTGSCGTGIQRNNSTYVYRNLGNLGVNSAGSPTPVTVYFTLKSITSASNNIATFAVLSNNITDQKTASAPNFYSQIFVDLYNCSGTAACLMIGEIDGTTSAEYNTSATKYTMTNGTQYYCRFKYDPTTGTYGTAYLYIATSWFDDQGGTTVSSQSLALHGSIKVYSLLYDIQSYNDTTSAVIKGIFSLNKVIQ